MLEEDSVGVVAEETPVDVLTAGLVAVLEGAVDCGRAVVEACAGAELVDLPLFGHKLEIIAPLKIVPSSDELLATTWPHPSRTASAI